jgi:hypothetical protein
VLGVRHIRPTLLCVCVCACTCVCVCVCVYMCMYICVVYVCVCQCVSYVRYALQPKVGRAKAGCNLLF